MATIRPRDVSSSRTQEVDRKEPSVFPLVPWCGDITNSSSVTLGCLVSAYMPGPVTVSWDTGALNKNIISFPNTLDISGLYTTVSQVDVSGHWAAEKFTCSVRHGISTPSNKTFSVCPKNFTSPSVRLFHSSCDPSGNLNALIQFRCFISGYPEEAIKVTWLENGQEPQNAFSYTAPVKKEGNLTSTYSEFNITQDQWVAQTTFTCRVSYQGHNFEDHARMCTEAQSEPRGVSTYLIPPSPLDLYIHNSPKITCLVVDLANKNGLEMIWSKENHPLESQDQPGFTAWKQFNGTFSAVSSLSVDAKDWIEGETYTCHVKHDDLPTLIERSITKTSEHRASPIMYVFSSETKEDSMVTLTCLAQNFFPEDISVQWLQNGNVVPIHQLVTTPPRKTNGSSPGFFVYSRLEVKKLDWERGDVFICRVVHEALSPPRTLEKKLSKAPEVELQHLCVDDAEDQELTELWSSLFIFITLFLISISYSATVTLCKVKWLFATVRPEKPPIFHDYTNILQPAA